MPDDDILHLSGKMREVSEPQSPYQYAAAQLRNAASALDMLTEGPPFAPELTEEMMILATEIEAYEFKDPSVGEYFVTQLGEPLENDPDPTPESSPYNPKFHIGTKCGSDCKRAIDAASELICCAIVAGWPQLPTSKEDIIRLARHTVYTYVYG